MEFHIRKIVPTIDLDAVEQAIGAVDPAVVADIDAAGPTLRIATSLDAVELASLLTQAGCPVEPQQVVQLPSICCGGCSG